jgi:hypothetical protein
VRSHFGLITSTIVVAAWVALAGCGDSQTGTTQPSAGASASSPTTAAPAPSGPLVRICDRALSREVREALRSNGSRVRVPSTPKPTGTTRLSSCDLGKIVEISMDSATDAVQRYQNRITESAQFAVDKRHFQPRPIRGVGSKALADAGANWLPWLNQLISARGKRVLIVNVNTESLPQSQRLSAARAISLAIYERLGSSP